MHVQIGQCFLHRYCLETLLKHRSEIFDLNYFKLAKFSRALHYLLVSILILIRSLFWPFKNNLCKITLLFEYFYERNSFFLTRLYYPTCDLIVKRRPEEVRRIFQEES